MKAALFLSSNKDASADRSAVVQWDKKTSEAYIAISDHPELRLTPLRRGDQEGLVRLSNDPQIARWADGVPYPYTLADADRWVELHVPEYPRFFPELHNAIKDPSIPPPLHSLNFSLRYHRNATNSSGTFDHLDLPSSGFVGGLHLNPSTETMTEWEMLSLPPAEQVWQLAYNVMPNMHGHGVGGRIVQVGLQAWIRWLGIGQVVAIVEPGNRASCAVLKDNGFEEDRRYWKKWAEGNGGGEREVIRWVWKA